MLCTAKINIVLPYFTYIVDVPYPRYDSRELKLFNKRNQIGK